MPIGGMGENPLLSEKGAGRDVPDVALVVGAYLVCGHEVAQQLAESVQLGGGVPLEVLETPVFLCGAILVDVAHGLALEVGDHFAVLRGYGVEQPVSVLCKRTPAVHLYADGLRVKFAVAEAETGKVVVSEAEVVCPIAVVEASVQMSLAADNIGGGHPLRGVQPPRHVPIHAVAGDGVVQHNLSLCGLFPDILRVGEVPVLVYLDHCYLVLAVLLRRSSLFSRAAFLSMMSSKASRMR